MSEYYFTEQIRHICLIHPPAARHLGSLPLLAVVDTVAALCILHDRVCVYMSSVHTGEEVLGHLVTL